MIGQLSWLRFDFPSYFRLDGRWDGFSSPLATSELVSDPQESPNNRGTADGRVWAWPNETDDQGFRL